MAEGLNIEKTPVRQKLPPGFNIISYPRKNGRDGGMAIILRELVKSLAHEGIYEAMTIKCSSHRIKLAGETLSLYAVFQIPSSSVLHFCGKLTTLLEQDIPYMHGRVLLFSNFNIYIDKKSAPDTIIFNDMVEGLYLRNNIEMEMHTSGHPLDLIIGHCKDSLVIAMNRGHQI